VLITGGSSGIGKAMAFEFYAKGAKVILASRNTVQLAKVCEELKTANTEFHWENTNNPTFVGLDLENFTDALVVKQKVSEILTHSQNGHTIDVLVNNAALMNYGSAESTPMSIYRRLMDVNFFGQVALTQALHSHIPDNGAILTIGSIAGRVGIPYMSAYGATKHALQAYMDCMRTESRPQLQILTVSAGYINSGIGTRAITPDGGVCGQEDPYQAKGYTVEYAAREIVKALVNRETELLLATFLPRLSLSLRLFTPNLLWYSLRTRATGEKTMKMVVDKQVDDTKTYA